MSLNNEIEDLAAEMLLWFYHLNPLQKLALMFMAIPVLIWIMCSDAKTVIKNLARKLMV